VQGMHQQKGTPRLGHGEIISKNDSRARRG
jgi:hypothetical protein